MIEVMEDFAHAWAISARPSHGCLQECGKRQAWQILSTRVTMVEKETSKWPGSATKPRSAVRKIRLDDSRQGQQADTSRTLDVLT